MELEKLNDIKEKQMKYIAQYLLERSKTDSLLKEKLLESTQGIDKCFQYITQEARKQLEKGQNSVMISDDEVFGWAVHFYLEGIEIKETKPKKETTQKLQYEEYDEEAEKTKETEEKANRKAQKQIIKELETKQETTKVKEPKVKKEKKQSAYEQLSLL